ncbi:MAG TPA: radical SAM protein [Polyangiaceae bacterium]|nr:radical SAM protein [Polyangiaceae bacterium]
MISEATRALVRKRLGDELGRIDKDAPFKVALAYPSPYRVGMSSLGYQQVYRRIQSIPGVSCERAFLPDDADEPGARVTEEPVSYESLRPLAEFPVVALSVAYELELAGVVKLLDAAKIPLFWNERTDRSPFVLAGGPLTFSNPVPLAPFVDALVVGEAEGIVEWAVNVLRDSPSREAALAELATHPNVFVPAVHGSALRPVAACDDALLPAVSTIRTPHTELSNMLLLEAERGCSRGCQYCVMRRSTNGGMRIVPKETVLEAIPADVRRVGLVGAAVSDHPRIVDILRALVERGAEVGLSSLRPDRLKEEFVEVLRAAGYRTLTTALDGASERLRGLIERRGREPHYEAAAGFARKHGMDRMKLYLMLGLPSETEEDIDECARFITELSRVLPVALGVAPFCAKRKTPLDGESFAGVDVVEDRIARLRGGLKGRADVRSPSARWAWVEYALAQGDEEEGRAVARAVHAGGRFADFRRELSELGYAVRGPVAPRVRVEPMAPIAPLKGRNRRLDVTSA